MGMTDPMAEVIALENEIRAALKLAPKPEALRQAFNDGESILKNKPTNATGNRLERLRKIAEALRHARQ